MMFIESVQEIDNLTFGQQKDLKKPDYKRLTLWDEGWETIMLGAYPKGQKVIDELTDLKQKQVRHLHTLVDIQHNHML